MEDQTRSSFNPSRYEALNFTIVYGYVPYWCAHASRIRNSRRELRSSRRCANIQPRTGSQPRGI